MRLSRRSLLARGGATAAGAALLGSAALPRPARAELGDDVVKNALLVVLPLVRATHVGAFGEGSQADTPNLNDLAGDSLRFDRAIPESMPALSARRALVTGMRAFPFRDWRATPGLPAVPGYNGVYDHQPLMTEVMRTHGVNTLYLTDNPLFEGERFPDFKSVGAPTARGGPSRPGIREDLLPSLDRASAATERTMRAGIEELRAMKGDSPFFLAVDPFDPQDAYELPHVYVKPGEVEREGVGPMNGRLVELNFGDDDVERVREHYKKHVEKVDGWVGRLMDAVDGAGLLSDTAIVVLGDHGIALGEHDYLGRAAPTSHRESYEIPYLIRHPGGDEAGNDVDWYASTHDVAPTLLSFLGLQIPGKMDGEDLTALFGDVEDHDMPPRPVSVTCVASNIIVRDNRFLLVADREQIERRLYDDDEEADDDNDDKRYDDVANDEPGVLTELSAFAVGLAGGTLPEFGPEGALRPKPAREDDDLDDDGIPNDFDAVDNDEPADGTEPEDLEFDGLDPRGERGGADAESGGSGPGGAGPGGAGAEPK